MPKFIEGPLDGSAALMGRMEFTMYKYADRRHCYRLIDGDWYYQGSYYGDGRVQDDPLYEQHAAQRKCREIRTGTKKPPLGVMPKWLWLEHRMQELWAAMIRFNMAGVEIPAEWLDETLRHHAEWKKCRPSAEQKCDQFDHSVQTQNHD